MNGWGEEGISEGERKSQGQDWKYKKGGTAECGPVFVVVIYGHHGILCVYIHVWHVRCHDYKHE
jgi:hypothetical protein